MIYQHFSPPPETLEDLKKMYRKLAFQWHPDRGGCTVTMQAINAEYDALFNGGLKNVFRNKEGQTYHKESNEAPEHFRTIIDALIKLPGLEIEIIGCFIWITGDTKTHKEKLKELHFRFHKNKLAWYLAPEGYRKFSRKEYSLEEIRSMYETTKYSDNKPKPLPLAIA